MKGKRWAALAMCIVSATALGSLIGAGCGVEDCSYGDWSVTKEASCTETGVRERVCSVHGEIEKEDIPLLAHEYGEWEVTTQTSCTAAGVETRKCTVCETPETRPIEQAAHDWSNWEVTSEATCVAAGEKIRVCLNGCGTTDTEEIAIDDDAHSFGAWTETSKANCTDEGKEVRVCGDCGDDEERPISVIPDAHHYELDSSLEVASTCKTAGKTVEVCEYCNDQKETPLPLDVHNHGNAYNAQSGICSDCNGLLTQTVEIDNKGVATYEADGVTPATYKKGEDGYTTWVGGDFEVVYTFKNITESSSAWHNYIFQIGIADYINGKLTSLKTDGSYGMEGGFDLVPFHTGDPNGHYGTWWSSFGNIYTVEWFKNSAGNDPGFENCMKRGADVTLTVTHSGEKVTVLFEMTTNDDGDPATFSGRAIMHFAGVQRFCLRLTGENSIQELEQVRVNSGTLLPETMPGTELLTEQVTVTNTTKNVSGYSVSLSGDFDITFSFDMSGNASNNWHSFILYLFKGVTTDYTLSEETLLWNLAGNGTVSEWYSYIYNNSGSVQGWNWSKSLGDGFDTKLADSKVTFNVSRRNGYISVTGAAYYGDETTPFALWRFYSPVAYTEDVTVRMTTEESTMTLKSVKLIQGTVVTEEK